MVLNAHTKAFCTPSCFPKLPKQFKRISDQGKDDALYLNCFVESKSIFNRRENDFNILMEPEDRDVRYRHLLGHTQMAVYFVEDIHAEVPSLGLIFDNSHIAQLNENLYTSWNLAKKYCTTHAHLANFVLNRLFPLYLHTHISLWVRP